ncbi:hypothetical protein [Paenibacillus sp. 7516]|uniref:hypothetical protein n=1 Tax=Paenibacillus sp. 7516 TaxID=2022549 RepID=UPI0014839BB9|nr:hypothetical protein [Paenibacillus sp. 7516]
MNRNIEDPKVKAAIRLLKAKGVTLEEIEKAYKYYAELERKQNENKWDLADWV